MLKKSQTVEKRKSRQKRGRVSASHPKGPRPVITATTTVAADLSHIAEPLRPLAVPCADLLPDPANARRHPEPNLEAIKASLRVYGQRKPVVVNRRTGIIEAGNGTLQAALALGWSHLAVVYVDDDPLTAAGFSIVDNRTAELAEWDMAALDKLLGEIKTNDPLLDQMLADLGTWLGQVRSGLTDPDAIPEPPDEAITQPGDLWVPWQSSSHLVATAGKAQRRRAIACWTVPTDPPQSTPTRPTMSKSNPSSNNAIAAGNSSFAKSTTNEANATIKSFDLGSAPRESQGDHEENACQGQAASKRLPQRR